MHLAYRRCRDRPRSTNRRGPHPVGPATATPGPGRVDSHGHGRPTLTVGDYLGAGIRTRDFLVACTPAHQPGGAPRLHRRPLPSRPNTRASVRMSYDKLRCVCTAIGTDQGAFTRRHHAATVGAEPGEARHTAAHDAADRRIAGGDAGRRPRQVTGPTANWSRAQGGVTTTLPRACPSPT